MVPSVQHVGHITQPGVPVKLVESALILPVCVFDRGVKHFSWSEVESHFGCNWVQPFQVMLSLFDPNTIMHKAAILRVV